VDPVAMDPHAAPTLTFRPVSCGARAEGDDSDALAADFDPE
jgi:hypothetical protein